MNQTHFYEKGNAKLYRLIEQQLLDSQLEINFEQLWVKFQQADRELRGTLSANQVSKSWLVLDHKMSYGKQTRWWLMIGCS